MAEPSAALPFYFYISGGGNLALLKNFLRPNPANPARPEAKRRMVASSGTGLVGFISGLGFPGSYSISIEA